MAEEQRLQKVLAAAGVASRRASEELIRAGRVTVNGETVTELGSKVDPAQAAIAVDGQAVRAPSRHVYMKLHKPRGILSDVGGDARGRKTVADLLPAHSRRLFPVGRLDLNSEGLVLMTDDGALAHRLTHPRFEHPKTYYVLLSERPTLTALNRLRGGIELENGRTAPAEVQVVSNLPPPVQLGPGPTSGVWLEVVLHEGKKRQIRHMIAAVGGSTLRLVRWSIGSLTLGSLPAGESAALTRSEVAGLYANAFRASRQQSGQGDRRGARGAWRGRGADRRGRPGARGSRPTKQGRRGKRA